MDLGAASERLWAPAAFLAYFAVSLKVGDTFPFSIYGMYAKAARRRQGAVPVFLADGKAAPIEAFRAFRGIDPDRLYPKGFPCSLEWHIHEAARWIKAHPAAPGEAAGPVRVQWGFRVLSVDSTGRLAETLQVVSEGTAWATR